MRGRNLQLHVGHLQKCCENAKRNLEGFLQHFYKVGYHKLSLATSSLKVVTIVIFTDISTPCHLTWHFQESSKFTVEDLENYVNGVHDEYVKSVNCGFDQFADHHWAYDKLQSDSETLMNVSQRLEENGYKYRWFENTEGPPPMKDLAQRTVQIYAFDPSGWTFQLDFHPEDDVPAKMAKYSAVCKSDDGCYGQGLCGDDEREHGNSSFVYNHKW